MSGNLEPSRGDYEVVEVKYNKCTGSDCGHVLLSDSDSETGSLMRVIGSLIITNQHWSQTTVLACKDKTKMVPPTC